MAFCVIDRNTIVTRKTPKQKLSHPKWEIIFPNEGSSLATFEIKTDYFKHICVTISDMHEQSVNIYDGPGTKCDLLNCVKTDNTHKYVSSTFQIVIYSLHNRSFVPNFLTHYKSLAFLGKKIDTFNLTVFSLSSSEMCQDRIVCVVKFETERKLRLNVTLSEFSYVGDRNTDTCDYAGVAIYDSVQNSVKLLSTECVKHHIGNTHQRICVENQTFSFDYSYNVTKFQYAYPSFSKLLTFYSRNNEFLVVLYSFRQYGSIKVKIGIAVTKCVVFHAAVCGDRNHVLYRMLKHTCLSPFPFFLSWTHQCVIVHVHKSKVTSEISFCQLTLSPETFKGHGKIMMIRGSGHFEGNCVIVD